MRLALALLGWACACATAAPAGDDGAPLIEVTESNAGPRGATCGVQAELVRGSVPADARVIVELELTSARAESMRIFENTARLHALERCATGVSFLRATDDDGRGYLAVSVALWERTGEGG